MPRIYAHTGDRITLLLSLNDVTSTVEYTAEARIDRPGLHLLLSACLDDALDGLATQIPHELMPDAERSTIALGRVFVRNQPDPRKEDYRAEPLDEERAHPKNCGCPRCKAPAPEVPE